MSVHYYRFDAGAILVRLLMSLVIWGTVLCLPIAVVWAVRPSMSAWWIPAAASPGILIWLIYTRQAWRRVLDRAPQLELHPGFLRAKQLNGRDIPWASVVVMEASSAAGVGVTLESADREVLALYPNGGRRIELDVRWLGYSAAEIFRQAEQVRSGALVVASRGARGATLPNLADIELAELGDEIRRFGPYLRVRGITVAGLLIGLAVALLFLVMGVIVGLLTKDPIALMIFGLLPLAAGLIWAVVWYFLRDRPEKRTAMLLTLHHAGLAYDPGSGKTSYLRYLDIRGVTISTFGLLQRVVLDLSNGSRFEIGPFDMRTLQAPQIGQAIANLARV